jgi:hypothetical protein
MLVMGIVDDVLKNVDSILGLRDDLGAIKHPIYILTREWSGNEPGSGTPTDSTQQVLPTPYLVDLSHSLRLREGGNLKQGDLLLKMISKKTYNEKQINCSVENQNQERWYYINGLLYEVISITEEYVYFNVQVRKASKQKTYL